MVQKNKHLNQKKMGTNNFGKKYLARKILGRKNWVSANPQTLGGGQLAEWESKMSDSPQTRL